MAASRRTRSITARAFAKVNLSLRILGVQADGYHELRTVFQSIALHDTLRFRFAAGPLAISASDPACPTDHTNLVWRAADGAWRAAGRAAEPHGVMVHIDKRIPLESGLGGGSSDAAAALRVFGAVWRVPPPVLRDLARSLGADVPFFLEGGTVLGLERGDLLFPLIDMSPAWVVVLLPDFGISTPQAYGWWDEDTSQRREVSNVELVNDLEAPVAARRPEIRRLVEALRRRGAWHAAMSGSGSAVFGLFAKRSAAERASRALATGAAKQGVKTLVTRLLGRVSFTRLSVPKGS